MSATGSYARRQPMDDLSAPPPRHRRRPEPGPDGSAPDPAAVTTLDPDDAAPDASQRVDLTGLSVAGITRRRVGWAAAALVAAWIVVLFARQVGDAQAASNQRRSARRRQRRPVRRGQLAPERAGPDRPPAVRRPRGAGAPLRQPARDPVHPRPVGARRPSTARPARPPSASAPRTTARRRSTPGFRSSSARPTDARACGLRAPVCFWPPVRAALGPRRAPTMDPPGGARFADGWSGVERPLGRHDDRRRRPTHNGGAN